MVHNALLEDFRPLREYLVNADKFLPFAAQADILREILGNPFRPSVVLGRDIDRVLKAGPKNFRQQDVIFQDWLTHNDDAVPKLARSIYDSQRWDELPILADALIEAGCEPAKGRTKSGVIAARRNAVAGGCCNHFADNMACDCLEEAEPDGILEHLRGPGPHARGCHVLDALLGLE